MHKAAQVPLMTVGDVLDLYFSRTLLECRVVGVLAGDRAVPAEAIKALQAFDTAIKDPSLTGIVDADVAFHVALVDALNSMRVSRMHAVVMGEAHLCMAQVQAHKLVSARTIAKEHHGIIRAIRSGDSPLAEKRAADHLGRARDNLIDYLTSEEHLSNEAVQ
jgi:DNA-binding GntR family transcriptional regulator